MPGWLQNWLERHRHPASFWLHLIAIPMLPAAAILAIVQLVDAAWSLWWRPAGLFVLSYFLQWVGHRIEGNDMGEIILVKKLLGKPYVAVAPRWNPHTSPLKKCGTGFQPVMRPVENRSRMGLKSVYQRDDKGEST